MLLPVGIAAIIYRQMISISDAVKILNDNDVGRKYTKEEAKVLIEFLKLSAELLLEDINRNLNDE